MGRNSPEQAIMCEAIDIHYDFSSVFVRGIVGVFEEDLSVGCFGAFRILLAYLGIRVAFALFSVSAFEFGKHSNCHRQSMQRENSSALIKLEENIKISTNPHLANRLSFLISNHQSNSDRNF